MWARTSTAGKQDYPPLATFGSSRHDPVGIWVRLAVASFVVLLFGAHTAPAIAASAEVVPRRGVSWGEQYHPDRDSLANWLAARGASYAVWAERHPVAAARLEAQGASEPRAAPDSSDLGGVLLVALALVGIAALALAWLLALPALSFRLGLQGAAEHRVDIGLFGFVLLAAAVIVYAVNQ
jgi:hypothetical protein